MRTDQQQCESFRATRMSYDRCPAARKFIIRRADGSPLAGKSDIRDTPTFEREVCGVHVRRYVKFNQTMKIAAERQERPYIPYYAITPCKADA